MKIFMEPEHMGTFFRHFRLTFTKGMRLCCCSSLKKEQMFNSKE